MYIERLDDLEIKSMVKQYLSMTMDSVSAMESLDGGTMLRYKDCIRYDYIDDTLEYETLIMTDFDVEIIGEVLASGKTFSKEHRKNMYRKFGKEYLSALDCYGKNPIEQEYKKALTEHKLMIEEISSSEM